MNADDATVESRVRLARKALAKRLDRQSARSRASRRAKASSK
jgi:hypothetical protein